MQRTDSTPASLIKLARSYARPSLRKSVYQILNTLLPFLALLAAMFWLNRYSYALVLPLAVIAGGFLIRLFIIQHDCGHGSFFRNPNLNLWIGRSISLFTFTPYTFWKTSHDIHHATAGNLDRRNVGDVSTWTVREYREASGWQRVLYRFTRNPFSLLLILAPGLFLFAHRFPWYVSRREKKLWTSVMFHNVVLAAALWGPLAWLGTDVIWIYLPVIYVAAIGGTYMFFVQHQFEGTYWRRQKGWNFVEAALRGSSYHRLPAILNWFTGDIAYHHIHHLCSGIPNYRLRECFLENSAFQDVKTFGLREGWRCFRLELWDEEQERLVSFEKVRRLDPEAPADPAKHGQATVGVAEVLH